MKNRLGLVGLIVLLSAVVSPQTLTQKPTQLALTHVTVIDTTGGPSQPDTTVVIRGDRIVDLGKTGKTRVPSGSRIVDATGKFLIPGLWDMDVLWYDKDFLPLFIANGVTGVRMTVGYAEHHQLRKEVEGGRRLGPHIVIGTRWIGGPQVKGPWIISISSEAEAQQVVQRARDYSADFLELSGEQTLSRDAFFALSEEAKKRGIPFEGAVPVSVSVEEASSAGMKSIDEQPSMFGLEMILAACSSRETDLLKSYRTLVAGQPDAWDTFWEGPRYRAPLELSFDTYDEKKAEALFALLKANHTWISPTLSARRNTTFWPSASDPRLRYMPAGEKEWWSGVKTHLSHAWGPGEVALRQKLYEKELETVGAMRRAGVNLLAGTATEDPYFNVPGFSLHDELTLLVQAGLTPLQALQTATLNPARFLGKERDFGTVTSGKVADLVLLDANPLEDIRNTRKISAVILGGTLFARESLDDMLKHIETMSMRKSMVDPLEATLKQKGVEAAIRQYHELTLQPGSYYLPQYGLTELGGQLLDEKRFQDAVRIYELNVEVFPDWWWAYDSLGGAYLALGEKDLAARSYQKSLHLDPANQHATFKLKQLNSQ